MRHLPHSLFECGIVEYFVTQDQSLGVWCTTQRQMIERPWLFRQHVQITMLCKGLGVHAPGYRDLRALSLKLHEQLQSLVEDAKSLPEIPELDTDLLEAIEQQLVRDGMVYRYRTDDGLKGEEGSFVACSFWYVECLARAGRTEQAHLEFEQLLRYANPLGQAW